MLNYIGSESGVVHIPITNKVAAIIDALVSWSQDIAGSTDTFAPIITTRLAGTIGSAYALATHARLLLTKANSTVAAASIVTALVRLAHRTAHALTISRAHFMSLANVARTTTSIRAAELVRAIGDTLVSSSNFNVAILPCPALVTCAVGAKVADSM